MFSGKNDRTEKNWNSFAAAAPEKKNPYWKDSLQSFNHFSVRIYQFKKGEGTGNEGKC